MRENVLPRAARSAIASPVHASRDKWVMAVALTTLFRAGVAMGGDDFSIPAGPLKPDFGARGQQTLASTPLLQSPGGAAAFTLPAAYQALPMPQGEVFTRDFGPRKRPILDQGSPAVSDDPPMLRSTTVWQRLSDYKAHGRVRLLTLWENVGGAVSLQAGRKGAPSLQWTSRTMNRGGATRGVLDQLVSMAKPTRGAGAAARAATASAEPGARAGKLSENGPGNR